MLYEIVNPSDPYTIEAESLDVAFVACIFLGGGQYGLREIQNGRTAIPLFIFGGCEEWCKGEFKESFKAIVDRVTTEKSSELAACLDSCLIGNGQDRETYQTGLQLIDDPAKREQWRSKWHEDRWSSLNNIGARAWRMARELRAGNANPLNPAPQQVFFR